MQPTVRPPAYATICAVPIKIDADIQFDGIGEEMFKLAAFGDLQLACGRRKLVSAPTQASPSHRGMSDRRGAKCRCADVVRGRRLASAAEDRLSHLGTSHWSHRAVGLDWAFGSAASSRCNSMCRNWYIAPTWRRTPRWCASVKKVIRDHGRSLLRASHRRATT